MTRVVEQVAPAFAGRVQVKKVITKTLEGAKRYISLVRRAGRQLPVPSIIINGEMAFETTPSVEMLTSYLEAEMDR